MKKIIITIMAITTLFTLTGCKKDEPTKSVASNTIVENHIYEDKIEEQVITETIIEETMYDSEGYELSLTRAECDDLYKRYSEGLISEEYYAEVLYNARVG